MANMECGDLLETPLIISPALAARIGLDEATMLHIFTVYLKYDRSQSQYSQPQHLQKPQDLLKQLTLDSKTLRTAMPFWDEIAIERIARSLAKKGFISFEEPLFSHSRALTIALLPRAFGRSVYKIGGLNLSSTTLADSSSASSIAITSNTVNSNSSISNTATAAFDDLVHDSQASSDEMNPSPNGRNAGDYKNNYPKDNRLSELTESSYVDKSWQVGDGKVAPLGLDWWPGSEVFRNIAQLGIPKSFAVAQVAVFVSEVSSNKEQSNDWNRDFNRYVLKCWREHQAAIQDSHYDTDAKAMEHGWRPTKSALSAVLEKHIPVDFIKECLPAFIKHWLELGMKERDWNSKFVSYVVDQWQIKQKFHSPKSTTLTSSVENLPSMLRTRIRRGGASEVVP